MAAFEFDPLKEAENQQKHGLPFDFALLLFEGPFVEEEDRRHTYGETRLIATGPIAEFGRKGLCGDIYVAGRRSSDHQFQESQ